MCLRVLYKSLRAGFKRLATDCYVCSHLNGTVSPSISNMSAAGDLHPFRTGTLDLDEKQRQQIKTVTNSTGSDVEFGEFISVLLDCIQGAREEAALSATAFYKRLDEPSTVVPLEALLLDFCRCNTPSSAVTSKLEDLGVKSTRASALAEVYSRKLETVRRGLIARGQHLPRLVDLTWRLDFVVSTSEQGKVTQPLYLIKLVLEDKDATGAPINRDVTFSCTVDELEELAGSMKDALNTATALTK